MQTDTQSWFGRSAQNCRLTQFGGQGAEGSTTVVLTCGHAFLAAHPSGPCAASPHDGGTPKGQSAGRDRSARPHRHPDARRCRALCLQLAAEPRLGEKSTGCSQDLVGPPQLLVLALQRLEPSGILAGRPWPLIPSVGIQSTNVHAADRSDVLCRSEVAASI